MANTMNPRGASRNTEIFNFKIEINKQNRLTNELKLNFIEKIFKFLLTQRSQLPLSYEKVKQEVGKQEFNDINRYKIKNFNLINDFLFKFDEIFLNLNEYFSKTSKNGLEINKILIIIGGSLVTPKESYYLNLNSNSRKSSCVVVDDESFTRQFFRSIFTFLQTIDFKEITASQIYFLFETERSEAIKWFLPKLNYIPPLKGKQIHITIEDVSYNMTEYYDNENDDFQELSFNNDQNHDISGIEPLNHTLERLDLNVNSREDLIWYQSPNVLKGVKHF
jgi:hypothetical protein